MEEPGRRARDLTLVAVPFYFASMAVEHLVLRRRAARRGPTAGSYEWRDTLASLAMGVGSLVGPLVVPKLLRPVTPGKGRYARLLVAGATAAVAVTTAADVVARRTGGVAGGGAPSTGPTGAPSPPGGGTGGERAPTAGQRAVAARRARRVSRARRVASVGGVAAVALGGLVVTTGWASLTAPDRLWARRLVRALDGPAALAVAVAGWDFLYYWDHRLMHERRYMWAYHVVHHSSEHYNLSTALRQPVAEALGTFVPYGALCLVGVSPELLSTARALNLLYQFWIHTEAIGRLGAPEAVLNTPSHHRVHHGANAEYLDRNHGSILIVWDRLFGTFEPEAEPVVYGLTKNIDTFDPGRIAGHEYAAIARDVAASTGWVERISYVVRGPGWATRHRAEVAASAGAGGAPPDGPRRSYAATKVTSASSQ